MKIDFSKVITLADQEAKAKVVMQQAIAARRWQAEVSGITIDGVTINTERESVALINGAALSAFMDDAYTCRWKAADGWVTLDAPTIKKVAVAVRNHVQACFDREEVLLAALEQGTFNDEMLEGGWPSGEAAE